MSWSGFLAVMEFLNALVAVWMIVVVMEEFGFGARSAEEVS